MSVQAIFLLAIPILYGLITLVELISSYSRVSGYFLRKNAIAYSFQNATFSVTRLFYILMMPAVGYLVDLEIQAHRYMIMMYAAFFMSGVFSTFVFFHGARIIGFYVHLIELYNSGGSLLASIHRSFINSKKNNDGISEYLKFTGARGFDGFDSKIALITIFIYTLHASGVFVTFYFALSNFENRVMISQLSGVVNAFGTMALTLKLEPLLSVSIENNTDYDRYFRTVFISRILVFIVFAPLFSFSITRLA